MFHKLIPTASPIASVFPSGLNATSYDAERPWCGKIYSRLPVAAFEMITTDTDFPDITDTPDPLLASIDPSGEYAMESTEFKLWRIVRRPLPDITVAQGDSSIRKRLTLNSLDQLPFVTHMRDTVADSNAASDADA